MCILLLCGCARFQFYKSAELSGSETGIKFYTAKPYLLVARTGNKEKPVEVSVVYLPDLQNPLYASPRSGFGSSNLTLSLSNGMLTAMGQQTDTKVPELLTSVGGLAEALATAKKTRREADLLGLQLSGSDYSAVAADLSRVADGLEKQEIPTARSGKFLTLPEVAVLEDIVKQLRSAATALRDPALTDAGVQALAEGLRKLLQSWEKQVSGAPAGATGAALNFHRNLGVLKTRTQAALAKVSPPPAEPPTFTLYEIDNSSSPATLKEVKFP
jgi:hypothetical protein